MAERLLVELIGNSPDQLAEVHNELTDSHGFADVDRLIPDHFFKPDEVIDKFKSFEPVKNAVNAIKGPAVTTKVDTWLIARAFSPLGGKIVAVTSGQTLEEFIADEEKKQKELDHYQKNIGKLALHAAFTVDGLRPINPQIKQMLKKLRSRSS